jgi:competence protein ComEC
MSDSYLDRIRWLVVVFVGLLGWRFLTWYGTDKKEWCVGCRMVKTMVIAEPVTQKYQNLQWRYQGKRITVPLSSDVKLRLGSKLMIEGVVGLNGYGGKELLGEGYQVVTNGTSPWWGVILWIHNFRDTLTNIYKVHLSEPHSSLLSGIVLGKGEAMPKEFYEALISSGTVHIVAASGYNVTLVARVAVAIFIYYFSRRVAIVMALLTIAGYVVIAGAGAAVMRAGIMGGLVFVAQALGREYLAGWGLVISSLVMLLLWPWLLFDASFQLSVSATAGILFLTTPVRNLMIHTNKMLFWLKPILGDLSTTLAATITTIPVILVSFERLSIVSPVVNLLVLWLVPPLMVLGGLMVMMGLVCQWGAGIISWFAWPFLSLFIFIIEFAGSLPWSSVFLPGFSWIFGIGWWLVCWSVVRKKRQ